jgi:hypothetical protein
MRDLISLRPPDPCTQAKLARASGFLIVPPATATFINRVPVGNQKSDRTTSLPGLVERMSAYTTASEEPAARRLLALEHRVSRLTASGFERHALSRLQRALFALADLLRSRLTSPGCARAGLSLSLKGV